MGADPEHDFQIVQVTRGLNRGARVGLDLWARLGAPLGVCGRGAARTLPRQCERSSSVLYLRVGLQCCKNV